MFAREVTRDAVTSYEVVIWGLIANGWLIFIKLIKPNSGQRKWNLSDLCENWALLTTLYGNLKVKIVSSSYTRQC